MYIKDEYELYHKHLYIILIYTFYIINMMFKKFNYLIFLCFYSMWSSRQKIIIVNIYKDIISQSPNKKYVDIIN